MARTLLVLRALGVGDLLTAVPSLRALHRTHRAHRLVLAAPAALEPLAAMTGAVDAVLPAQPLQPLPGAAECADVAGDTWDRIVTINLLGTAAVVRAALPALARNPRRGVT
ncbi:MAG: glycosyltransferase family 9 protein, partial [Solirubrobacterales bacterium]